MDDEPRGDDQDFITPAGLTLLERIADMAMRTMLILRDAEGREVGMNLDELIDTASRQWLLARQAHGAATLLAQGAALDRSWSPDLSRPRAVYARHNEAVKNGAERCFDVSPGEPWETDLARALIGPTLNLEEGLRRAAFFKFPRCQHAQAGEQCKHRSVVATSPTDARCNRHLTEEQRAVHVAQQQAPDWSEQALDDMAAAIVITELEDVGSAPDGDELVARD